MHFVMDMYSLLKYCRVSKVKRSSSNSFLPLLAFHGNTSADDVT